MRKKLNEIDLFLDIDQHEYHIEQADNDLSPEGDSCMAKIAGYLSNRGFEDAKHEKNHDSNSFHATPNSSRKSKSISKLASPYGTNRQVGTHEISKCPSIHSVS